MSATLLKRDCGNMSFPKNLADVLRTPILWYADRLLLPKYPLIKIK